MLDEYALSTVNIRSKKEIFIVRKIFLTFCGNKMSWLGLFFIVL